MRTLRTSEVDLSCCRDDMIIYFLSFRTCLEVRQARREIFSYGNRSPPVVGQFSCRRDNFFTTLAPRLAKLLLSTCIVELRRRIYWMTKQKNNLSLFSLRNEDIEKELEDLLVVNVHFKTTAHASWTQTRTSEV